LNWSASTPWATFRLINIKLMSIIWLIFPIMALSLSELTSQRLLFKNCDGVWRAWRPCSGSSSTYPSTMIDVTENISHGEAKMCAAPSCMYHIRALTGSGTCSTSFGRPRQWLPVSRCGKICRPTTLSLAIPAHILMLNCCHYTLKILLCPLVLVVKVYDAASTKMCLIFKKHRWNKETHSTSLNRTPTNILYTWKISYKSQIKCFADPCWYEHFFLFWYV
jgi:hypothetical protein